MDGKQLYEHDPDGWWEAFWKEAGKMMSCKLCPFSHDEDCGTRGCGNVLANKFLMDYTEGQYEW